MSNPFDDLKSDDGGRTEPADENDTDPGADSMRTVDEPPSEDAPNSSVNDGATPEQSGAPNESSGGPGASLSPAESGPAFEYSEVQQKPFYARTETVDEFKNTVRTSIVPTLAEADVLDEETREIHDAILRLANERPERVAELVLEERRQSGPE
ncbi:hypothetical protein GS429_11570 [Natronorubrum sp. JWXQ-INN-674]|uniref:Uncharacterized protein n=1 Tax=Natronorubrum halalkaliphilum TaxID=2691917 RepID=A0A6B0VPJ9_9EURY|nr:hypothetical protein [Natronorubrum halalkaliphilum]MXV62692.1 hypothetical protein [Natronorubrum halalkaliphilum]